MEAKKSRIRLILSPRERTNTHISLQNDVFHALGFEARRRNVSKTLLINEILREGLVGKEGRHA